MSEAEPADPAHLRKKLARMARSADKNRGRIIRMRGEEPVELSYKLLSDHMTDINDMKVEYDKLYDQLDEAETNTAAIEQDQIEADKWADNLEAAKRTCEVLMTTKQLHSFTRLLKTAVEVLERAITSDPEKKQDALAEKVISFEAKLEAELQSSSLATDHQVMVEAREILIEAGSIRSKMVTEGTSDVPKSVKSEAENPYKLVNVPVPRFSGRIQDWVPFWSKFQQQVANRRGLDDQGKLAYLLQGMSDLELKGSIEKQAHKEGAYKLIVAELHDRYDQPRTIHKKYCDALQSLEQPTNTRASMMRLADALTDIHDGFVRLKAEDCKQFITTMAEPSLNKTLKDGWTLHTEARKDIPPVQELISYIKMKASQAPEEELTAPTRQPAEKSRFKPQKPKYRGSTNTVAAPAVSTPSPSSSFKGRGSSNFQKSAYPPCRYECPLCDDNHYAWACTPFEQLSVAGRKEHVKKHNLCNNCLKPGHMASDCRSTYKCKTCQGSHNTLIHEERAPANNPAQASNHMTRSSSSPQLKDNLMMTSQVRLTGPTGMTTTVRALLDSGSSLSIASTHVTQMLALNKQNSSVCIEGVGSAKASSSYPLTTVTLSPLHNTGWERQITVAVIPKVTRDLPMQGASSVRSLPHLKDLKLADRQFDSPGTIDLLLGQDIWQDLFLPGEATGPPGTPSAWNTVFGWVVMGNYSVDDSVPSKPASVHAITALAEQESDKILARFFEGEEAPKPQQLLTPEKKKVEEHYEATHAYVKSASRYMVCLPRKESAVPLGESRSQALNRARANEKSLLHKGSWKKSQEVMQEYFSLHHAEPVSQEDINRPAALSYYMPMHGVYKESSTTTKLRVVFDASAKTTSHHSLNDSLAVGPTLHPTLDRVLLKFRTYPVAISGYISKMYREVLLHPEDRHYHRFIWRAEVDQSWQEFQMNRVTFGVAASPYLAVKTLQQAAKDFGGELPQANWHINHSFYVDDLLGGASNVKEALSLYSDRRQILGKAGFQLRKWRSRS